MISVVAASIAYDDGDGSTFFVFLLSSSDDMTALGVCLTIGFFVYLNTYLPTYLPWIIGHGWRRGRFSFILFLRYYIESRLGTTGYSCTMNGNEMR